MDWTNKKIKDLRKIMTKKSKSLKAIKILKL